MYQTIIPPHQPEQSEPVRPPMIYIKESSQWEYKQIIRNFEKESPPDEAELNELGAEGWELSGIAQRPPLTYFYFKRLKER